jgi:hypothetical protein
MDTQNTPSQELTIVSQAVAEIDSFKARIAEVTQTYLALKINTVEDTATYEAVVAGLRKAVKTRTTIEAKRKEYTAPFVKAQKDINARAKEVAEALAPIETHLSREKATFERLQEEKRRAEYHAKLKAVTSSGAQFDGTMYVAGPFAIHPNEIAELTLPQIEAKAAEIAEWVRLDNERKAREEAERKAELARLEALKKEEEARLAAMPALEPERPAPPVYTAPPAAAAAPQPRPDLTKIEDFRANNPVTVTASDYQDGFNDCRAQVLALFADGVKRTRGEFIEMINALTPRK